MTTFYPSPEAFSVVFAAALVWTSALVQHGANVYARGADYVMSDPSVAPDLKDFFGRATRTLANNIESAAMFAPPMLLALALGRTSKATALAALVYVAATAVFSLCYWFGIPVLRPFAWLTGMICCAGAAIVVFLG
ncbi:MAG TPA: MAPEG family protein [Rhodoblastus sp.]|nr:MAPEG family protein [Rhodoblastus sp.]